MMAYDKSNGNGKANGDLAAHTPSPEYMTQAVKRRILELLGAEAGVVNALAPLPYKSKYPFAPKLIDAAITMQIDPIVKPLSLKGKLDKMPALKKLSGELADRGFFRKYPGGGIGIGGGGGSPGDEGGGAAAGEGPGGGFGDDATSAMGEAAAAAAAGMAGHGGLAGEPGGYSGPSTAGEEMGGFGPSSEASMGGQAAESESGPAGPASDPGNPDNPTGPNLAAMGRAAGRLSPSNALSGLLGAFGFGPTASAANLSAAVSSALAALGLLGVPGLPGVGLGFGTLTGMALAQISELAEKSGYSRDVSQQALAAMAQDVAASDAATGIGSGQSGGEVEPPVGEGPIAQMPFAGPSGPARRTLSPAARANAAARAGGGISDDFIAALEALRGAA